MSIFSRIKDAIFGSHAKATSTAPSTPANQVPSGSNSPANIPAASAAPAAPVDVEAVLQGMAAQQSQKLNWRTSIVDLMKLVGLDSSLENRKELASELGYKGNSSDSSTMNVWLHKQVMQQLAVHGGKVPAELQD